MSLLTYPADIVAETIGSLTHTRYYKWSLYLPIYRPGTDLELSASLSCSGMISPRRPSLDGPSPVRIALIACHGVPVAWASVLILDATQGTNSKEPRSSTKNSEGSSLISMDLERSTTNPAARERNPIIIFAMDIPLKAVLVKRVCLIIMYSPVAVKASETLRLTVDET